MHRALRSVTVDSAVNEYLLFLVENVNRSTDGRDLAASMSLHAERQLWADGLVPGVSFGTLMPFKSGMGPFTVYCYKN